jgi:hypothetical protein
MLSGMRPNKIMLGALIDLTNIALGEATDRSNDILGREDTVGKFTAE